MNYNLTININSQQAYYYVVAYASVCWTQHNRELLLKLIYERYLRRSYICASESYLRKALRAS